jgi:hypothetical protein
MKYVTLVGASVVHGAPVEQDGIVGVAVKQKAPASGAAAGSAQNTIVAGEKFAIISKGLVQVPVVGSPAKGAPVYMTAATNALTLTGPGAPPTTYKFGQVAELAGERGCPTGFMRVDLDAKDSFV